VISERELTTPADHPTIQHMRLFSRRKRKTDEESPQTSSRSLDPLEVEESTSDEKSGLAGESSENFADTATNGLSHEEALPSVVSSAGEAVERAPLPTDASGAGPQSDSIDSDPPAAEGGKTGLFGRLRRALARTGSGLVEGIGGIFAGGKVVDADLIDELETLLLSADVGIEATDRILGSIAPRLKRKELGDAPAVVTALKDAMMEILAPVESPLQLPNQDSPFVILMVGVNGAGKTTTIGKLSQRFLQDGKSVVLAAGDTFRAAATEQLQIWGDRHNVPVVAQSQGADSASVAFDALDSATARGTDVLIVDTAGRLHTQSGLMAELAKVRRVLAKRNENAPHEVLLVLDASTGQNALVQATEFSEAVSVTGIVLTKLDGTAKGGVILSISERLGIPIRFIGVGEGAEDLREFVAQDFVDALFGSRPDA